MHGDLAWFTSSAKYSTVTERLTSLELTPLNGSDFGKDKMPLDVLGEWLKDTNRGCASTY
jgi:hypothetical protein